MSRPLTVVTGGGRGIGAATAIRLAGAGHDLVVGYLRDKEAVEHTAGTIRSLGARCRVVAADLTEPEAVDALFDEAAEEGVLTGLVNNAGATLHIGDLAQTPVDVVRRVVDINLTAALLCARRAVRAMGRSYGGSGGVIVNVSSGAATLGAAHEYVHYAAAKAGVDAMTVGLAQEVAADGVRVNGVAPGIVRTDIHAAAGDPGRLERVAAAVPLGRVDEPDEVAAAITWLLGDDCPYMTGATLRVAGGR